MKKITMIIVLITLSLTPFHSLKISAEAAYVAYSQDFSDAVVNESHPHFSGKNIVRSIGGNNMLTHEYDSMTASPYWGMQLKGDYIPKLPPFSNFELSFDVIMLNKIDNKQPAFGFFIRAGTNQNDTYRFSYYPNRSSITKGIEKIMVKENVNTVMELNKKYSMKIVAQGMNLKWYVDGNLIIEANDDTYSAGNFWFTPWACQVAIDNITITTTDPKPVEYVAARSVTMNKKSAEIELGKVLQLYALVYPTNATNKRVYWKSSDESVATVNDDGIVTAKKLGETTIRAFTVDGGYGDYCDVTVVPVVSSPPSEASPSSSIASVQSKAEEVVAGVSSELSVSSIGSVSSVVSTSSVVSNEQKSGQNNMSIIPFIVAFAVVVILTAGGIFVYIIFIKNKKTI